MSVTVKVPTPLRKFTDGQREVVVTGGTVKAALEAFAATSESLAQRLFGEGGELRADLRVFVGADDIRTLQGIHTPLAEGAALSILPPVAGA